MGVTKVGDRTERDGTVLSTKLQDNTFPNWTKKTSPLTGQTNELIYIYIYTL